MDISYFHCGKPGHFAHYYTKPKVLYDQTRYSNIYFSSYLMLVETVPYWTVDFSNRPHREGLKFLLGFLANFRRK